MSNARNLGNITTSGLTGDLVVDTNTLVVDSANNRVGIGIASPTTALDVSGTITATSLSGNVTGQVSDISNHNTDDLTEGTNLYYTDARVDARLASGSVGNIITTGYIAGPATFTIDPAAVGDNTGTVVIAGNLQVDGTQTIVNSTAVEIGDKNIILGADATANSQNNGAGLTILQPNSADHALFTYNETTSTFEVNRNFSLSTTSLNNTDTARISQTGTGNNNKFVIQADGSNSSSPAPVYAALELVGRAYDNTASTHGRHALIWVEPGNLGDSYQSDLHFSVRRNASEINLPNESTYQMSSLLKLTYTGNLENLTGDFIIPPSNSSGRIGVGTSSPSEKLEISNTSGKTVVKTSVAANSTVGLEIEKTGSTTQSWLIADGVTANGKLEFYNTTDSRSIMTMINTGYVGIGSASPDAPLYIDGSVYSSPYGGLRVVGAGTGAGTSNADLIADFGIGTSGSVSGIWLGGRTDETTGIIGAKTASGNLAFEVYQSGWKERMRINNTGRLLVGTDTSSVYYNSSSQYAGDVVIDMNITNNVTDLVLINSNNSFGSTVDFATNNSSGNPVRHGLIGAVPENTSTGTESGRLYFATKNTTDNNIVERMRISPSGKIGVNNTSPVDATTMDINQGFRVNNLTSAADFSGVGGIMLSHTMTLAAGVQTDMIRLGNREGCFVLTVYIGWSDSGAAAVAQYDVHTFYATNTINQVKRAGRSGGNDVGLAITSVNDYHTFKVTSSNNSVVTITVIGTSAGRTGASNANHFTVNYY